MSKTQARLDLWRQLVAKQQESGMSVRIFCEQHGTSEYSFYHWRKRLREQLPMKFALIETSQSAPATVAVLEVIPPRASGYESCRVSRPARCG